MKARSFFIFYGLFLFVLCSVLLAFHMFAHEVMTEQEPIDQNLWRCQQKYGLESSYMLDKHGDAFCTDKRGRKLKDNKSNGK